VSAWWCGRTQATGEQAAPKMELERVVGLQDASAPQAIAAFCCCKHDPQTFVNINNLVKYDARATLECVKCSKPLAKPSDVDDAAFINRHVTTKIRYGAQDVYLWQCTCSVCVEQARAVFKNDQLQSAVKCTLSKRTVELHPFAKWGDTPLVVQGLPRGRKQPYTFYKMYCSIDKKCTSASNGVKDCRCCRPLKHKRESIASSNSKFARTVNRIVVAQMRVQQVCNSCAT
jgi:hypothetical protein